VIGYRKRLSRQGQNLLYSPCPKTVFVIRLSGRSAVEKHFQWSTRFEINKLTNNEARTNALVDLLRKEAVNTLMFGGRGTLAAPRMENRAGAMTYWQDLS
jgi:hypothetical protein